MPNYTDFKKTFCDCCKSKESCCYGWRKAQDIAYCIDFIDWEAVMDTKDFPEHDYPRCDSIYQRTNITFFIEQKNIRWFVVHDKLKHPDDVVVELKEKFEKSAQIFEEEGNMLEETKFVLSYDLNSVDEKWLSNFERDLRNKYFPYIEAQGVKCGTCRQVAYYTIHGTEFEIL